MKKKSLLKIILEVIKEMKWTGPVSPSGSVSQSTSVSLSRSTSRLAQKKE